MNINNKFEAFWKRTLESTDNPEVYMKGYIKELCRDAFSEGYRMRRNTQAIDRTRLNIS
jgi:hypothetical protein